MPEPAAPDVEKLVKEATASAAAAESSAAKAAIEKDSASASAVLAKDAREKADAAAKTAVTAASSKPYHLIATIILTLPPVAAAFYFGTELRPTLQAEQSRMLISTLVCFIGIAFACLGFGLFLAGATGAFKGSSSGHNKTLNVDTAAPGLVVIVCATVVIYLALDLIKPPAPAPAPAAAPAPAPATSPATPDAAAAVPDGDAPP